MIGNHRENQNDMTNQQRNFGSPAGVIGSFLRFVVCRPVSTLAGEPNFWRNSHGKCRLQKVPRFRLLEKHEIENHWFKAWVLLPLLETFSAGKIKRPSHFLQERPEICSDAMAKSSVSGLPYFPSSGGGTIQRRCEGNSFAARKVALSASKSSLNPAQSKSISDGTRLGKKVEKLTLLNPAASGTGDFLP